MHHNPVKVIETDSIWWEVEVGKKSGYAAKYYFAEMGASEDHVYEPWYFGEMTREEAEQLLGNNANPDGKITLN